MMLLIVLQFEDGNSPLRWHQHNSTIDIVDCRAVFSKCKLLFALALF